MTKTKTKLSRNAKRVTARRRAQKEQQQKRSGGFSVNQMLAGQSNPMRRVRGGFLTDTQRQQLAKAGRDIDGTLLPYVKAHTFKMPASVEEYREIVKVHQDEIEPLEVPSAATNEIHMTLTEMTEYIYTAKRRKKGLTKLIQKDGWQIDEGDNPKDFTHWYRFPKES